MPLYEYLCEACGGRFEVIQKFSDSPPDACRVCGKGPVHRQHSSPAIQFKGSGFYITDYGRKGSDSSSTGSSSAKSDGGTSEGKTETAAKTDTAKTDTAKADTAKTETPAAKADKTTS